MTEKNFQLSNKIGDAIWLVRGDTLEEFMTHYHEMTEFLTSNFSPAPVVAPNVAQSNNGEVETDSIEVESIEFMGKNRWVVKGGWATQYGITCWPEVLEAAGLLEHLDMNGENVPHKAWNAIYTKKPKKEGDGMTADKVIRLEPVA